jgi:hypothetical protein
LEKGGADGPAEGDGGPIASRLTGCPGHPKTFQKNGPSRMRHGPGCEAKRIAFACLRWIYAVAINAITRFASSGSRSALCGLRRCVTSPRTLCTFASSAARQTRAVP